MCKDVFIYRIDRTDTIVSVSDNWATFADANAWGGFLRPEDVVGHSLWDFIQDLETRHLYEELFRRVRAGMTFRPIPFRLNPLVNEDTSSFLSRPFWINGSRSRARSSEQSPGTP